MGKVFAVLTGKLKFPSSRTYIKAGHGDTHLQPRECECWSLVFASQTFSSKWKVLGLAEKKKYDDFSE